MPSEPLQTQAQLYHRVEIRQHDRGCIYVNKEGGTRSASLNSLASDMARWFEVRNIDLIAEHLPGVLNSIADRESRREVDWNDWRLHPEVFSGSIKSLEDFGRPFRQLVEQPVSEVRILEASLSGVGSQRVLTDLEGAGSLFFPPFPSRTRYLLDILKTRVIY